MKDRIVHFPWGWFAAVLLTIMFLFAVHDRRMDQIRACERSHESRDLPTAEFARAAQESMSAAYQSTGKKEYAATAYAARRAARSLEELAAMDCRKLYPPSFLGI